MYLMQCFSICNRTRGPSNVRSAIQGSWLRTSATVTPCDLYSKLLKVKGVLYRGLILGDNCKGA